MVVYSGDMTQTAAEAEYDPARAFLTALAPPLYVLPGNRDSRTRIHQAFSLTGSSDEPVLYAAESHRPYLTEFGGAEFSTVS